MKLLSNKYFKNGIYKEIREEQEVPFEAAYQFALMAMNRISSSYRNNVIDDVIDGRDPLKRQIENYFRNNQYLVAKEDIY